MVSDHEPGVSALPARAPPRPDRKRRCPARAEAERELVAGAQRGGVLERQQLIQKYRPLIASMARRYFRSNTIDTNELMQEGCVGLLQALRHYDFELGVPFGAYARWWVRRAIQQLVAELSGPVVLSERALRQLAAIKRSRREFEQAYGRRPKPSELAVACELPEAQIVRLLAADLAARTLGVPGAEDDRDPPVAGCALADPGSEDDYESTIWRLAATQLPRMLARLGEREQRVIRARFGVDCRERTLGELAGELCVSAERVRQIESAALRKLSAACDAVPEPAACGA